CNVFIKGDGSLRDGSCVAADGVEFDITRAELFTDRDCVVTGEASDSRGINYLLRLRISRDRSMMAGVIDTSTGDHGTVIAVKH
ncbi:MAG: hypothetical protein O7F73_01480, partial [Gammaproteobacteria bacterium]|nr:hypothetical protein [Gammaproteobacteria bacterium]